MVLSRFDIWIIVLYFVIVIAIAFFSSRKQSKQSYLIAERKLGTFETLSTITSSKIATGIITSYVAFVYLFGISAMWLFVGYALGYILFYFFAKKLRPKSVEKQYFTLADYFYSEYGKLSGFVMSILTFLLYSFMIIIQFIGGAKILSLITGLSFFLSLFIVTSVIFLYIYIGGFKAVVRTDIAQYVAMVLLLVVIFIFLFKDVSLISNVSFETLGLSNTISFLLLGLLIPLSTVDLYQRVYAAKSKRVMKKGLIGAAIFFIILGLVISVIAMIIRAHVTGIDPDVALVAGFLKLLPSGILGLGVVTLFAIVMSSADTYLFTQSSIFTHDVISRLSGNTSDSYLVKVLRYCVIFFTIITFAVSMISQDIVWITTFFASFTIIASVAVLGTWIKKNISEQSIISGIVFGIISVIIYASVFGVEPKVAIPALIGSVVGMLLSGVYRKVRKK